MPSAVRFFSDLLVVATPVSCLNCATPNTMRIAKPSPSDYDLIIARRSAMNY
jgi:hypothetical protein